MVECACEKHDLLIAYYGRDDGPWWVCLTCDGLVRPITESESLKMAETAQRGWRKYQAAKAASQAAVMEREEPSDV